MATADSTRRRSDVDFPLYFHKASGHWCKTIAGRRWYFGKDKAKALAKWKRERDDLLAGNRRPAEGTVITVRYVCNYLLTAKKRELEAGEVSKRQFDDLKTMAGYLIENFGENRSVESLRPDDFGELRAKMAKRWSTAGLVQRINNIKSFFNFAYKNAVLRQPVQLGTQFAIPKKKVMRQSRQQRGKRDFRPEELRALLFQASPHVKAFILLGLNCGVGNTDIAVMKHEHIDLDSGWLDYPRRKTSVERRCKLWDETVEAIREAVATQPTSTKLAEYVFLTRRRNLWSDPDSCQCALSQAFTKLAKCAGVYARGKSFYALRHTFETVAGETRDQVAVDHCMGHDSGSIANEYRERISDERLEAVADHVHAWLFRSGGKAR